jgi:hypothetical protein
LPVSAIATAARDLHIERCAKVVVAASPWRNWVCGAPSRNMFVTPPKQLSCIGLSANPTPISNPIANAKRIRFGSQPCFGGNKLRQCSGQGVCGC